MAQKGHQTHLFQPPKGTRDFFPQEMAIRRHLESIWRHASINHGFDEIDGPTFEHLDLYTVKSGPGIVSELFSFRRSGGDTDYALRPEFTPTLARMYAANANSLPKPTKWFCIPSFFRAERPQRGRLREFFQWNVDLIGDDSPRADAEVMATAITVLEQMGLTPADVQIKCNHREVMEIIMKGVGIPAEHFDNTFDLLDRRDKLPPDVLAQRAQSFAIEEPFNQLTDKLSAYQSADSPEAFARAAEQDGFKVDQLSAVFDQISALGLSEWLTHDPFIARGLAYYTGTVFELHETTGKERAIAGGGRYDGLVELFGGPPTPAVGFAMGDVVIRLVLEEKGLLKPGPEYLPPPDLFVITSRDDLDMHPLIHTLRRHGLHIRHSYRATKNVGKLLGEAGKLRARFALILGEEINENRCTIKNLESGEQLETIPSPYQLNPTHNQPELDQAAVNAFISALKLLIHTPDQSA